MSMNGDLRIMLVDDEPAMLELLRVTFESAEVAVEEATCGAGALESKDLGSARHSHRVRSYAMTLLELIDPGAVERDPGIEHGFLLHDVGKIGIPDSILGKRGPLTRSERLRMQTHTLIGERM